MVHVTFCNLFQPLEDDVEEGGSRSEGALVAGVGREGAGLAPRVSSDIVLIVPVCPEHDGGNVF